MLYSQGRHTAEGSSAVAPQQQGRDSAAAKPITKPPASPCIRARHTHVLGPVKSHTLGGNSNINKLVASGKHMKRATAVTAFVNAAAALASAVRVVKSASPHVALPHVFRQPVVTRSPGAPSALADHFSITVLEQDIVAKVVAAVSAESAEARSVWLAADHSRKMNSQLQVLGKELKARITKQLAPYKKASCVSRLVAGKTVGCEQAKGGVGFAFAGKEVRKAAQCQSVCPWAGATAF